MTETLKGRKKVVLLDMIGPPWAEHQTAHSVKSVFGQFSLFWLFSSMLEFKRNNGFKVLTVSFKCFWGCSRLYWVNRRTHSAL